MASLYELSDPHNVVANTALVKEIVAQNPDGSLCEVDMIKHIKRAIIQEEHVKEDCLRVIMNMPPKHCELFPATRHFITVDEGLVKMCKELDRLAYTLYPVLFTGPTGVGKEILARAMHPTWRKGKFVAVNCAAIPATLLESELFGHVKGAFTGADKERAGLFQAAEGGTLFLDEIFDMPQVLQAKLLRVLQPVGGRTYLRKVGSDTDEQYQCRIVCASMKSPQEARPDLVGRLSTFHYHVKGLNDRFHDAEAIMKHLFPLCPTNILESYITRNSQLDIIFPYNVRTLYSLGQRWMLNNA